MSWRDGGVLEHMKLEDNDSFIGNDYPIQIISADHTFVLQFKLSIILTNLLEIKGLLIFFPSGFPLILRYFLNAVGKFSIMDFFLNVFKQMPHFFLCPLVVSELLLEFIKLEGLHSQ